MSSNILAVSTKPLCYEKLEDFFSEWPVNPERDTAIVKTEGGYELSIVLPGVEREQIEIGIIGDILSISVGREAALDNSKSRRSFMMGDDIDLTDIETKYEQGILTLILRSRKNQ